MRCKMCGEVSRNVQCEITKETQICGSCRGVKRKKNPNRKPMSHKVMNLLSIVKILNILEHTGQVKISHIIDARFCIGGRSMEKHVEYCEEKQFVSGVKISSNTNYTKTNSTRKHYTITEKGRQFLELLR